jgi:hypothetical protein
MQVKVTPLNFNPATGQFEPSTAVNYVQLAQGRLRIRVGFLPMNEQQHELIAELLGESEARIVNGSADPLLRITREDEVARLAPGQAPKVHAIGSPLFLDIEIGPPQAVQAGRPADPGENSQGITEIGPRALPAGPDDADQDQLTAGSESAGPDVPAATTAPATPTDASPAPPAENSAAPTDEFVDKPDELKGNHNPAA